MSYRRNSIAVLGFAAGLAAAVPAALAAPGNCAMMGGWERFQDQRAERMEQHQKRLHDALKLTPDQEGAWQQFTQATRPLPPSERGNRADWAKLTTPERADRMLELAKQHQERLAQHVAALKTFYGVLTPEQKKIFDEQHLGPGAGRRQPAAGGEAAPPPAPRG